MDTAQPLSQVLKTLEETYDIKFSYQSQVVQDLVIVLQCNSVDSCMQQLQSQLPIKITKISDRYYAINRSKNNLCFTFYDAELGITLMDQPVTNLISSKAVMINEEGYAYFNTVNQKELQL